MNRRARSIFALIGLGITAILVTGCGTTSGYLTPSGSTTTLMAGWESRFALDWQAEPESGGARRVSGYVTSRHGEYALYVRLLAQALDPSGKIVGQRIVHIQSGVSGFQRTYFDVPDLPPASSYRVSVWDYTYLQSVRADAP